ncbi:hypothetical protein ACI3PG_12430, partial [Glaesserella parasuis]
WLYDRYETHCCWRLIFSDKKACYGNSGLFVFGLINMRLWYSTTSPYVRKARAVAHYHNLQD